MIYQFYATIKLLVYILHTYDFKTEVIRLGAE